jgi:uncharacterized membrane protein
MQEGTPSAQSAQSAIHVRERIESVDVVRGAVMILMALDHVRDFFGTAANPTDPGHASAALFFTRWVTHFCAPTFFFLAGTSAYLTRGHRTIPNLARFLFTRGIWLIVLELTAVRCFGYQFNVDYQLTMLVILWALGWSMIVLAALVHLPANIVGIFGLVLIAGHNLFDAVRPASLGAYGPLWSVLHVPGVVSNSDGHLVFADYPLIPWVGVTAAGYCIGQMFSWPSRERRRSLVRIGLATTASFVLLRLINGYGDPSHWTTQASPARTLLSFLNVTKYPPSLLFLLMTLGPALLALSAAGGSIPPYLRPVRTFGRVPLFYFVLHLMLIHLLAVIVCLWQYHDAHWMLQSPALDRYPFTRPPGWGFPLPAVYAVWIAVILLLYPACRWFADVKRDRRAWWVSYL